MRKFSLAFSLSFCPAIQIFLCQMNKFSPDCDIYEGLFFEILLLL